MAERNSGITGRVLGVPTPGLHPVAAAHRSRAGRRAKPSRASLHDRDVDMVLRHGWLPSPDDLPDGEGINFIGMDELRQEHDRHLEQMASARRTITELQEQFATEDAEHQAALKAAFDSPNGSDSPPADKRTSEAKRKTSLQGARESVEAARASAIAWAEGALQRARDLAPDWAQTISSSHGRLNSEIEQLQAQIAVLRNEQRADQRFVQWNMRLLKPFAGQQMPFADVGPGVLPADYRAPRMPGGVSIAPPGLPDEDTDQTTGAA